MVKKTLFKIIYRISGGLIPLFSKINFSKVKKDKKYSKIVEEYEKKELFGKNTFDDKKISSKEYDLSIIIPVYNSEKYLKRCLDSVANQKTKYNFQVICINDGSTDSSPEILKMYMNKIKDFYVINQENQGISISRNNGIKASSGKYLGFIDNDDWITEDYIEKLLDRAYSTDADIVKCNHINYSIDMDCSTGVIRHEDASIKKFGLNIMEFKGYIWGGIIKREMFKDIRFPENYWYEDIMMRFTLMRLANDFEYIDENLYYYALHKTNASKTLWKKDDIKTLDFYYLLRNLCCVNDDLKIERDSVFYNQLLYELGANFWLRTRKLNSKFRKTLFIYACELSDIYYEESFKEYFDCNKYLAIAFNKRNYFLWKLVSFHIICGVHIKFVK